jgi:signal peptidase II
MTATALVPAPLKRVLLVAGAIFALDQLTKLWIVEWLDLASRFRIDVVPGTLTLIMAWNRGVNFGILASDAPTMRFGLAALAVAVSVGVAVWAVRRGDRWFGWGAGLLIGGAIGNAVDRLRYGAVADFLNVTCCGIMNPYAFNVADIAIFVGAVALALAPTPEKTTRGDAENEGDGAGMATAPEDGGRHG